MLVVTHEMGFALSAASEVLFMEHGLIAERGPPSEIPTSPVFERTRKFVGRFTEYSGDS